MRNLITIGLFLLLLAACSDNGQTNSTRTNGQTALTNDTVVDRKTITNEIAGSNYRERATGYFIVVDKDTSDFTCIFYKLKREEGGTVGMDFYEKNRSVTYRQRMNELRLILPYASKDFEFDSLTSIILGRLVSSGDLAIDITNQYKQKFGTRAKNKVEQYKVVEQFLAESKLGTDLNNLFRSYSISVDHVSIEKAFFTTKVDLYSASKIETDSASVPDKILDCQTWVGLKRN